MQPRGSKIIDLCGALLCAIIEAQIRAAPLRLLCGGGNGALVRANEYVAAGIQFISQRHCLCSTQLLTGGSLAFQYTIGKRSLVVV